MLLLPAVGIVWLWADAFWYLYSGRQTLPSPFNPFPRPYRLGLTAVIFTALLFQNLTFIKAQLNLYRIGGTAIQQAAQAASQANQHGRSAVFINLPAWIAPLQATYALGQEGDNLILGPDMVESLVWAQTGLHTSVSAVRYDDIRVETPYYTGPVGAGLDVSKLIVEEPAIYVSRYETAEIRVEPAAILGLAPPESPPLAAFGDSIQLLAAAVEPGRDQLTLTLTWQLLQPAPFEMTVFVHALDSSGAIITQADGDPAAGTLPFGLLPPGTIFHDIRVLPAARLQSLRLGLYNRFDGSRWPALNANGQPFPDNALSLDIPQ
jgi:hypothetical protein